MNEKSFGKVWWGPRMIIFVIGAAATVICLLYYLISEKPNEKGRIEPLEPFILSEHFSRMEQASLDILENQESVDKTIILFWGMDGLRLNEDGSLEWISRKKPKPVNQNISYQPCQSLAYMPQMDMVQSTADRIEMLMQQNQQLQFQMSQQRMMEQIVQCCAMPLRSCYHQVFEIDFCPKCGRSLRE